ncbi:hypothetical protein [Microlunatus antarcticus]|uniref:Uncharacterized protein n=1 Tax=Microlunatus antarcticus TaxID=53388 RepID=A0A7W5P745_9ACTN|nr:hypothetical protein [Microlunatus antarcticus]MBB3327185.1 hypothetical protein [Microlunatus antarcticus]
MSCHLRVGERRVVLERILPVASGVHRGAERVHQLERVVERGDLPSVDLRQLLDQQSLAGLVRHLVRHHQSRLDHACYRSTHLTPSRTGEQHRRAS